MSLTPYFDEYEELRKSLSRDSITGTFTISKTYIPTLNITKHFVDINGTKVLSDISFESTNNSIHINERNYY